jgi:NAD-dependent DNA ligase
MNQEEAKKEIHELIEKINYYNEQYYQQDTSLISDFEFDKLMEQADQTRKLIFLNINILTPPRSVLAAPSPKLSKLSHTGIRCCRLATPIQERKLRNSITASETTGW